MKNSCVLSDDAQIVSLTHLGVSWQEEQSLLQLEEAIEALDANLELKNRSIQDRQKALLTSDTSLSQLQNMEPVKLANMARKLEGLPPPEVLRLLARYFNRVRAKRTHINQTRRFLQPGAPSTADECRKYVLRHRRHLAQNSEQLRSGNKTQNLMTVLLQISHISSELKERKAYLCGATDD